MISYRDFRRVNESEAPTPGEGVMADITKEIDALFDKIKDSVHQMTTPRRGWVDNVRGKWWNLFYGSKNNPNHPEYRRNASTTTPQPPPSGKMGEDGGWRGESTLLGGKMTLQEYRQVDLLFSELESNVRSAIINETHAYKVDDMIDAYKEKLKQVIQGYVQRVMGMFSGKTSPTTVPSPTHMPVPSPTHTPVPDPTHAPVPSGPAPAPVPVPSGPAPAPVPDPSGPVPAPTHAPVPDPVPVHAPVPAPVPSGPVPAPSGPVPDPAAEEALRRGRKPGSKNKPKLEKLDLSTISQETKDILNGMIAYAVDNDYGSDIAKPDDKEWQIVYNDLISRAAKGEIDFDALTPDEKQKYISLAKDKYNAQQLADLAVGSSPTISPMAPEANPGGEEPADAATSNVPHVGKPSKPPKETKEELRKNKLFPNGVVPRPPHNEPTEKELKSMTPEEFKYFIIHDDPHLIQVYWLHDDTPIIYTKDDKDNWEDKWLERWWIGDSKKRLIDDYLSGAPSRQKYKKKNPKTESLFHKVEYYKEMLRQEYRPKILIREAAKLPLPDRIKFYVEKLRQG